MSRESGCETSCGNRRRIWNFPNQVTISRLVLALVMFVAMALRDYHTSFVFFLIAAGTDWLDGFYARRYGQVTTLGRILDPFADKVIVCGAFIFLVAVPVMSQVPWGLRAWMVVVIVGRELLVTALRSFLEEQGADFSAKIAGKLKMVFQCIAVCAALVYLWFDDPLVNTPTWIWLTLVLSLWIAVALTVYSGIGYVFAAVKLLRK